MTLFFLPCNNRFLSYNLFHKIMRNVYYYKQYLNISGTATVTTTTTINNVMMKLGFMNT